MGWGVLRVVGSISCGKSFGDNVPGALVDARGVPWTRKAITKGGNVNFEVTTVVFSTVDFDSDTMNRRLPTYTDTPGPGNSAVDRSG